MTSDLTDYGADALRDALWLGVSPTFPTTWYVGLGDGTGTELAGTYSRVALTLTAGTTGQAVTSAGVAVTPPATTTALELLFFDASTAGNCWLAVAIPVPVDSPASVNFDPGDLIVGDSRT